MIDGRQEARAGFIIGADTHLGERFPVWFHQYL
jgi:hypothetical protein